MPATHRALNCLKLNLRAGRLALGGRWMTAKIIGQAYDRVAPTYDEAWARHIWPVTGQLIERLPAHLPAGHIFDLGCGTGRALSSLAQIYASHSLTGIDVSAEMLRETRTRISSNATLIQADMLEFLRQCEKWPPNAALVFSSWAIGYSRPFEVIRLAARQLVPGGTLAFIVNCADTMAPVFDAYKKLLGQFPSRMKLALWPRFPEGIEPLRRCLMHSGIRIHVLEEGRVPITPPPDIPLLQWLLKTGVLAGFDHVLPLLDDTEMGRRFAQMLQEDSRPLEHHYVMALAGKAPRP